MSSRNRSRMRELIDLTVSLLATGEISLDTAAEQLRKAGVPFEVICRVLLKSNSELKDLAIKGHETEASTKP